MLDLSVDLSKESVLFTTGDVLTMYAVIIAVSFTIAIVMFKWANRKDSRNRTNK